MITRPVMVSGANRIQDSRSRTISVAAARSASAVLSTARRSAGNPPKPGPAAGSGARSAPGAGPARGAAVSPAGAVAAAAAAADRPASSSARSASASARVSASSRKLSPSCRSLRPVPMATRRSPSIRYSTCAVRSTVRIRSLATDSTFWFSRPRRTYTRSSVIRYRVVSQRTMLAVTASAANASPQ